MYRLCLLLLTLISGTLSHITSVSDDVLYTRIENLEKIVKSLVSEREENSERFNTMEIRISNLESQLDEKSRENFEQEKLIFSMQKELSELRPAQKNFVKETGKRIQHNISRGTDLPLKESTRDISNSATLDDINSLSSMTFTKERKDIHPTKYAIFEDAPMKFEEKDEEPEKRAPQNTAVAFSSKLGHNQENTGRDRPIIFDSVLTNEGGSYNGNTGVFTCEVAGTYVFHATILAQAGKRFAANIAKNGASISWLYAFDKEDWGSASTSVIVNLSVGDTVLLRSEGFYNQVNAVVDKLYSSFSGYLIR